MVLLTALGSLAPSGISVYASEKSKNEYDNQLKQEVKNIYQNLIQYDAQNNKYFVDMDLLEETEYTADEAQGVYLMKDALNAEIEAGADGGMLASKSINEANFVIDGNNPYELINHQGSNLIQYASSWDTVTRCIQEAWGHATSLVAIKGVVDLLKAGRFAAAASKLASVVKGRILGVAAASVFLLTCGAQKVS